MRYRTPFFKTLFMYDISTVQTAFFDILKWRQFDDPSIPPLDASLVTGGDTPMYYNDINPMLYPENIEKVLKHYDSFSYDAWSAVPTYAADAKVLDGVRAYVAKSSNVKLALISGVTAVFGISPPPFLSLFFYHQSYYLLSFLLQGVAIVYCKHPRAV